MICKQYEKQKQWYADSEAICNYLKQHKKVKGYLSDIEFVLDIPYRTLSQCCAGYRKIPLKFIQPLKEYLKL
jgi:hypothetical protein